MKYFNMVKSLLATLILLLFQSQFLAQINYELNVIDTDASMDLYDAKTADLDGDGLLDIIFSNESGIKGGIWYKNLGNGSYEKIEIETNVNIRDLEPYDVDQDGDIDLLYNSATLTTELSYVEGGWFENDGIGNFQKRVYLDSRDFTFYDRGSLENEDQLIVEDFNNDGLVDVSISCRFENSGTRRRGFVSYIYLQNFDHSFERVVLESYNRNFNDEFYYTGFGLSAGDINGDGLIDIAFQRYVEEIFYWLENSGGNEWEGRGFNSDDTFKGQWLNLIDVDGDGHLDVYSFIDPSIGPFYTKNDGQGNFTRVINSDATSWPRAPKIDIDGDGDLDGFENEEYWEENLGDFSFVERLIDERLIDNDVDFLDLDGDGDMDLVQYGIDEDTILTLWEHKEIIDYSSNGIFDCNQIAFGGLNFPANADVGDFDGDGLMDIYVGTSGGNGFIASAEGTTHIAWYKNLGNGNYQKHPIYAPHVAESAARDFDNDGDPDIVYARTTGSRQNMFTEYIFLENIGNGEFIEESIYYDRESAITEMRVVDLNNDGLIDFYTESDDFDWEEEGDDEYELDERGASVRAFYNRGNGEFFRRTIASEDDNDDDEVLVTSNHGDVDGDGLDDVVVHFFFPGFSEEHEIYLFINDGVNDFEEFQFPELNYQSFGDISIVDIDQDGMAEIGRFLDYETNVWFNFNPESFVKFTDFEEDARFFPIEIDFDGDGDLDRVHPRRVWYQENIGNNQYASVDINADLNFYTTKSYVDVDNDGDFDIVSSYEKRDDQEDNVYIWYNDGSQNFDRREQLDGNLYWPEAMQNADLDQDGDQDLIVADFTGNRLLWFENDGSQNFTEILVAEGIEGILDVNFADIDLDGDLDILAINRDGNDNVNAWLNDGNQNFTFQEIEDNFISEPKNILVFDYNKDAYPDFIVSSLNARTISIFVNDQQGSFDRIPLIDDVQARSMVLIDMNNNGFEDLIAADAYSEQLIYFRNNEGSGFTPFEIGPIPDVVESLKVVDFDGDMDFDIISASFFADEDGRLDLWINDGTENFSNINISAIGSFESVTCGDYDSDGDVDIISSAYNTFENGLTLWQNDGNNSFTNIVFDNSFFNGRALITTDVDGNGSLDILGASNGSGIKWWQNGDGPSASLTIDCPADITVNSAALSIAVEYAPPIVSSDCLDGSTLTLIDGGESGSEFEIGTNFVIYEATDACGSAADRCTTAITIQLFAPIEITCPEDIFLLSFGTPVVANWEEPLFETECYTQEVEIEQIAGPVSGSEFSVGTTTITYRVSNQCGDETTCSFDVVVEEENSSLSITCPDDIFLIAVGNTAIATWGDPTFQTTCDDDLLINIAQVQGPVSGSSFPIGMTTITYEVSDECENIETCSFNVVVEEDDLGPTESCPENIDGFQSLGTLNGHNYYLSNSIENWRDAEMIALEKGGYLVSIGSAAENDFLANQINELAFIGYHDADLEGSFKWSNGEAASYENLMAFNSNYADYTYMNFWDGSWNLSGRFTERKFIVEINCADYTSCSLSANINSLECDDTNVSFEMTVEAFGESTEWVAFINGEEFTGEYGVTTSLGPFPILEIGEGLSFFVEDGLADCSTLVEYFLPDCPSTVINCPEELAGYSLLGEFNGHKYFISDILTTWTAANDMADAQGANLVTINDQEENSFLENNIFEIVFIGLSDQNEEGNLLWANGDALSYSNYADCFFCASNSEDRDYAHMNFWDGAWSFDGPFTERRHIIEFECSSNTDPGILPRLAYDPKSLIDSEINIYPNPVIESLSIEINAVEELEENIFIYDARGALIFQQKVSLKVGNNKIQIAMDDYPNAMYVMKFSQLNEHRKFIKKD